MVMRFLLMILLFAATTVGVHAGEISGCDSQLADSLVSLWRVRTPDAVEGIWQVAGMRSVIAVVSDGRDNYKIFAVDVDAPSVMPGTVLGFARPTAKADTYDAKIFTKALPNGKMAKKADFLLTVHPESGRLTMRHYYRGVAVRIWRSLPYLTGARLGMRDTRPEDIDGWLRLWPIPVKPPVPVIL